MDFAWSREQEELRAQAREVASDAVVRYGRHHDSWIAGFSKPFAKEIAARGWIGLSWPRAAGGGGRPAVDRMIVAEELISAGAPVGSFWIADRQMGPSINAFGTPEQRARFLPPILSGDHTWCIGMSEPDAGSDLASIRTTAHRRDDVWVVRGQKIWTSFAAVADYCYLICRTSQTAVAHAGISELIVPMDSPGVTVRPIRDMAGESHFCEVFFDDVRVPASNLVGEKGGAFKQTMRQLEHERGGIDRLVSNHALYRAALAAADPSDPRVRQDIAALETTYRIGRLLIYREALGQGQKGLSAVIKCICTEHEARVADFAARIFGPAAGVHGEISQGVVFAPAYTIMGGTANILRNVIAERMLGLPKEPAPASRRA